MADTTIEIRGFCDGDRMGWDVLWQRYQDHLRRHVSRRITDLTWQRLVAPSGGLFGLCATFDTYRFGGFVHYGYVRSTWRENPVCQIHDVYVAEDCRGRGAGRALVEAVYKEADSAHCEQVIWFMPQSDMRAKILFDKVASTSRQLTRYQSLEWALD